MDMNRILQVFIGAVLFLSSCSTKDNNETSVSPEMCLTDSLMQVVSIDTVHTRILIDELTLNGRVTFNQEQVVQVFPMFGGRVIAVNAEVGDYVHKGEVLAVVKSGEVAEYEKQLRRKISNTSMGCCARYVQCRHGFGSRHIAGPSGIGECRDGGKTPEGSLFHL